jgi:hypothetical protein
MREFDERLNLDKQRLKFDQKKAEVDADIKRQQIRSRRVQSSSQK